MSRTFTAARLSVAFGAAILFSTGCTDNGGAVKGDSNITSIDHIDPQDWSEAAEKLTNSMLSQDKLFATADGSKVRIGISRIINETGENVDPDLLVKKIRVTLNRSGKVVTSTTLGLSVEDPLAKQNADKARMLNGDDSVRLLGMSLSGKMIENRSRAGNNRQSAFSFQLTLTDQNGDAVWEDEVPIIKSGRHNAVGL